MIIGLAFGLFTRTEICHDFSEKSSYLFDKRLFLNKVFEDFVMIYLDIGLEELLPYVQYSSSLYRLNSIASAGQLTPSMPFIQVSGLTPMKSSFSQFSKALQRPKTGYVLKERRDAHSLINDLRQIPHAHDDLLFSDRPFLLDFN